MLVRARTQVTRRTRCTAPRTTALRKPRPEDARIVPAVRRAGGDRDLSGQNDTGAVRSFNFRDERYLPFEFEVRVEPLAKSNCHRRTITSTWTR